MLEQMFNFEEKEIDVLIDDKGDPWWIAHEVGKLLEISNPRNVVARLDSDMKGVFLMDTLGGEQKVTIINLPGLFDFVLSSRKSEAQRFKRWVLTEVLPQIMKTGTYGIPTNPAEQALILAQQVIAQHKQITELTDENNKLIPRAKMGEQIIESKGLVSLSNWGRMSKLGARKIFDLLESDGILWRNGKYRHPYSYYMDMLYFELKEKAWQNDKNKGITLTLFVTPKGQEWLTKRYL